MIDPLSTLAFSLYGNKGVFACLLGSGLSRAAQIPTGWEVTLSLIERVALLKNVKGEADWATWYKAEFKKDPSYSDLLDALTSTPDERRSVMHGFIDPTEDDLAEGRKIPTKAHRAIAKLVQGGFIRAIVTTNFDRLIERAIQDLGVEPTVIKSVDDLKGAVPIVHSRCYVIKVHGDYLDTRIRNTEGELSSYPPELDLFLDRIFDEFGLIVCGWSGDWDGALRAAIARAPNRRYPMFWAVRGPPSAMATDLIQHRDGKTIAITDGEHFFEDLERLVSAQVELQRRNPRSTDLLIASTKQYLLRPEFRIKLDDLIGLESRELSEFSVAKVVNVFEPAAAAVFPLLVARCDVEVEPLARIYGVLGRWGSDTDLRDVTRFIKNLATHKLMGGDTIILEMQSYPAMLLMYSYGLGSLKSEQYSRVFELFSLKINDVYTPGQWGIVCRLFLTAWGAAADPRLWSSLAEFHSKRSKTPLSDHLSNLFSQFSRDYIFVKDDFPELFDEFELLGSLAYITIRHSKDSVKGALNSRDGFIFTPLGGFYRRQDYETFVREYLNSPVAKARLLEAGFTKGDAEFLDLATNNIVSISSRMRWS